MSTDPDHTTDGPDLDGMFDALDAIDALREVDMNEEER
jgi:hypothetical protein